MFRVDCYKFFKLGQRIHPLTALKDEDDLFNVWFDIYQAKLELNSFFQNFPLRISRDPANRLFSALSNLVPNDISTIDYGDAENGWKKVDSRGFEIRQAAIDLETVLAAELNNFDTYFVSQKGAFSTSDLVDRAESMLVDSAHPYLSDDAKEDIRQAGRCLAFNLGTAAAFHIVRAAETFIWKYYEEIVGALPPKKMRNWGAYIKNLEKCASVDMKVLGWMKQIKDEYRNPVLHPDEVVSPDDALEFMNACLSLMASISRVLAKNAAAKSFGTVIPLGITI